MKKTDFPENTFGQFLPTEHVRLPMPRFGWQTQYRAVFTSR